MDTERDTFTQWNKTKSVGRRIEWSRINSIHFIRSIHWYHSNSSIALKLTRTVTAANRNPFPLPLPFSSPFPPRPWPWPWPWPSFVSRQPDRVESRIRIMNSCSCRPRCRSFPLEPNANSSVWIRVQNRTPSKPTTTSNSKHSNSMNPTYEFHSLQPLRNQHSTKIQFNNRTWILNTTTD